jgi:glycosyltransferase involved in cell wall biosynthesis
MISVIICTYNPIERNFDRAVQSVLNQNFNADWEFVIVDNNSAFPVSSMHIVQSNSIRVVVEVTPGLTAARECAVRVAKGDILIFADDDNVLSPDYLEIANKIFTDNKIGVISGTIIPEYETIPEKWFKPLEKMIAIRSFRTEGTFLTQTPVWNEYFPIGAGMCIRRELLLSYFDNLTEKNRIEGRKGQNLSSGEDLDIDFYAIHKGYLIGVHTPLAVKHLIPKNRYTVEYLCRLSSSSALSCFQINRKWHTIFNGPVFKQFGFSIIQLRVFLVIFTILFPLKRYRISYYFYKTILHARNSKSAARL